MAFNDKKKEKKNRERGLYIYVRLLLSIYYYENLLLRSLAKIRLYRSETSNREEKDKSETHRIHCLAPLWLYSLLKRIRIHIYIYIYKYIYYIYLLYIFIIYIYIIFVYIYIYTHDTYIDASVLLLSLLWLTLHDSYHYWYRLHYYNYHCRVKRYDE